jgi:photosystem II stability/assembly factor-like uncharacterized protein
MLAKFSFPQAAWNLITALPGGEDVTSISIVDSNVVFVVTAGNGIYRTLDGGKTWESKNTGIPSGTGMYGVSAVDSLNCIVGWLASSGTPATIYRTTDGGKSWTSVWTLAGSFPDGIKMFSPSYGVFIGDPTGNAKPYQFRYTIDSGKTWNLSPTSPIATSEFGVINAFDFIDTNRIWVGSANTLATGTTAKIYKTTTGINGTWSSASVSGTKGAQGLYFQAIAFVDTIHGMAGSNNSNIVKTTDGGATWTPVVIPSGLTSFAVINMTGLKDGSNKIWMSVNTGVGVYNFYFTTDFGTTWTSIALPVEILSNGMQHVQFFSPTLGYSGGVGGVMFKYSAPATGIIDNNVIPVNYNVFQNYPNPFNPSTTIQYQVPENTFVNLRVYNSLGQETAVLVNGMVNAGTHEVQFNASNLSSGIYFYVIKAGEKFVQTRKMILLK